MKPGEYGPVERRGALQLDVQELELEQQPASQERKKKIQEAPSDPGVETIDVAGLAEDPTYLEGPVVPARRKLPISGNLPPNNVNTLVESAGARRRGRTSTAKFSAEERGRRRKECVDVRGRGNDDFSEEDGATGADSEGHVTGAENRQQAMNAPEMDECRKVRKNKKCKVARPNDKLVAGARVICNRKRLDRTEKSRSTDVDLPA